MSHSQQESARGTAKEPTIEYSDSTRTTAAGSEAYGDPKVYGSNPNPHNDVSKFGRDTHVNKDSLVKDRADGKDRLGNDSDLTGSTQQGDLSGTTVKPTHGGDFAQHSHTHDASHVHDSNCSHSHDNTNTNTSHLHNNNNNTQSSLENASSTGGIGAIKASKVPGAGTFDTEKNTHKQNFDGPVHGHGGPGGAGSSAPGSGANSFDQNQNHSGAFGGADVGGSGVGTGTKSDYDALGNRVGPGHQEGHTFLDENHGEKVGIVDKIKGKLGMNTGDERYGDFSKVDQHGANHAGGQGGADRL